MPRISKRTVDATHPTGAQFFVWDDVLKGFGLRVTPAGVKSFVYQYRTAEGRTRRATVAKVGTVTPDKARELAEDMAATVKKGGDPLGDKSAARESLTVGQLMDAYLESAAFAAKAESTQGIDKGRIERHLRPLIGKHYAAKLGSDDVQRAFNRIASGKTAATIKTEKKHGLARVTGGEGTARAAVRLLRAIFNWAHDTLALHVDNPCSRVKMGQDGERDVILDSPEQYERLFRTLEKMEAEKRIRAPAADAIRLIAMTGARRSEIIGLRWKHVDMRGGRIVLPASSHKTGSKTGKARIIPLATVAQQVIARQPQGKPDELVFRPARGNNPIHINKPWRDVRAEADLPEGIGLHGLRHSVASLMAMDGAGASEIQAVTGHRDLRMVQRYVHFADNARAGLAERAAAFAAAGMAAAAGEKSADVVPLADKKRRSSGE